MICTHMLTVLAVDCWFSFGFFCVFCLYLPFQYVLCSVFYVFCVYCYCAEFFSSVLSPGGRPRGRPKKTWREIVEKYCKARGLNREDAVDCSRWRKQIGMIDDHDECEWVNVSSSTGSSRLSRTKSKEP